MSRLPALRRALGAPWLWLGLGGLQLALAAGLALPLRAVVRGAMGPLAHEGGQVLAPLFELLGQQRGVAVAFVAAVATAAALAGLLAPLLAGAAIRRLGGKCGPAEQARAAIAHWPAALATGFYGHVLRVILVFVAAALGAVHPWVQLALTLVGLSLAALAVDLARARVVLGGARGLHPRTFVRALATAAARPRLWLRSGLLSLLGWALTAAIVLVALHGVGTAWAPWAARGLALLGTFVALWRISVAVEQVETATPPP